ncbi:MAG: phage portal protein, partial [Chloroflexi bacterium]
QIPQAAEAIRNELYKSLTGVGNAGRSLVSHIPLEIQTFEQADLDKNTAILDTIRNRIFSAFRVPLMLVGDNTNTPYKEANETLNAFIQLQVKPLAERITQFINQQLMPAVMASELFRFEFVYDDYQTVSSIETSNSTLTIQQYTSGIIDRAEAKRRLGVEPDAQDNGVYAVNLQPADSILFSKTTSCSCGDHHGHDEPPTAIRTLIPRSSIKSISPDDIAAVAQWMERAGLAKLTAGYTELQRTLAQAGGGSFDNVEVDWNEDDFETLLGQYRLEAMELANQLERGQISPQQWLDQMTELLRRFHIAAGIVGVGGVENVNNGTLNESENNFYDQLGYLVNWAQTGIAIGLAADAILNRAMLYAANGRATAERARLRRMGLPELPAYPGDGTTDCRTNCKCRWDIKKLDGDGNFDCRWVIDPLYENCQHCVARSKTWQPLEIRGGVIKPYPRDANLWR